MRQKHRFLAVVAACTTVAALAGSASPTSAQIGNFGYGSSTAGGSGGTPTGPTNLGGIYGFSSSGGSGGISTGLTNPGTLGYGLSTGGGSGGLATGPTNPTLPLFGGTAPAPTTAITLGLGRATPEVVDPVPSPVAGPSVGTGIIGMGTAPSIAIGPGPSAAIGISPATAVGTGRPIAIGNGPSIPIGPSPSLATGMAPLGFGR
jgi:hypothetical protein